jgi:para-nitrobenzyl esterase
MREDCLVLNVWAPADGVEGKPVLVWLHGGAFMVGSASWPLYDFSNLARDYDVVVVGVNHRLGILGFLDLSAYGQEYADSGNAGMLDIVLALQWVRDNIAGFGGNPNCVTVFGESGGGAKVNALLGMPSAAGLFQRAVLMSGTMLRAKPSDTGRALTETALGYLGIDSSDVIEQLLKLDAMTLVESQMQLPPGSGAIPTIRKSFSPTIGATIPGDPVEVIRAGAARTVEVMLGTTTHELLGFLGTPEVWNGDDEFFLARMRIFLGDDTDSVIAAYRTVRPDDTLLSLYLLIASDHAMRIPHIRLAEALIAGGGAAPYMYLFELGGRGPDGVVRSGHGGDMAYFFDNISKAPVFAGPHAQGVVDAMAGALTSFARTGDAGWSAYDTETRPTKVFNVESRTEDDPMAAERRIWQDVTGLGLM